VRRLTIGNEYGVDIDPLLDAMTRMEEISLYGMFSADVLSKRTLQHLRIFKGHGLIRARLEEAAANPTLARLTHLELDPSGIWEEDSDAPIRRSDLRALIRSKHLGSLRYLALSRSDFGDEGCEDLAGSDLLRRLKVLKLARGAMTDAGARTLAACKDLKKLDLLDVSENRLTNAAIRALQKTGIKVEANWQRDADDDSRQYLFDDIME
jgi:hypothetical protein